MKKKLFKAMLLFLALFSWVHAANYVHSQYAVDNGEIRWGGSTTYMTQYNQAINTWNNYGAINIAPDTWFTYQDLTISDINDSNETWFGLYYPTGAKKIKFNIASMWSLSSTQRQNVATHELWHALGLLHSVSQNIMVDIWGLDRINLWTQDKEDYDFHWD